MLTLYKSCLLGNIFKSNSYQFLDYVFEFAELDIKKHVVIDPKFYRPCEVPKLWGDPGDAMTIMGWKPEYDFEMLAMEMYEADFRKEQKKMNKTDT